MDPNSIGDSPSSEDDEPPPLPPPRHESLHPSNPDDILSNRPLPNIPNCTINNIVNNVVHEQPMEDGNTSPLAPNRPLPVLPNNDAHSSSDEELTELPDSDSKLIGNNRYDKYINEHLQLFEIY